MEEFSKELASHTDQQQVSYVLQGLWHGFRLGFHSAHKLKPAKRNKPPALHHTHISSFGVFPKKGQPGKWHLIVDLSSPGGASVNDDIDPQDFSLQYIKVDQVSYGFPLWPRGPFLESPSIFSGLKSNIQIEI